MVKSSNRFARIASIRGVSSGHVSVPMATSLALAFALMLASSAASATSSSRSLQNIPMGDVEVKGGTTKIGEIDPAVIRAGGSTTLEGTLRNGGKATITGFDVALVNADTSAGTTKLAVHGLDKVAFDAHGIAHVEYPWDAGLAINEQQLYVISALKADPAGPNVIVSVKPSVARTLPGSTISCNVLPGYELDAMSDLARNGIAEMDRAGALAFVKNADASARITTLKGTVYLLDVAEKLTSVRLLQSNGEPLPDAKVDLDGDRFTATGFSPIGPQTTVLVVMVFGGPVGGTRMRAQIQALFDE